MLCYPGQTIINSYVLLDKLGQGSFGQVGGAWPSIPLGAHLLKGRKEEPGPSPTPTLLKRVPYTRPPNAFVPLRCFLESPLLTAHCLPSSTSTGPCYERSECPARAKWCVGLLHMPGDGVLTGREVARDCTRVCVCEKFGFCRSQGYVLCTHCTSSIALCVLTPAPALFPWPCTLVQPCLHCVRRRCVKSVC
jgi:hypothetical protein